MILNSERKKVWAEVGRGEERKGGKTPAHVSLYAFLLFK